MRFDVYNSAEYAAWHSNATTDVGCLATMLQTYGARPASGRCVARLKKLPKDQVNTCWKHSNPDVRTLINIERFYDLWVEHYPKLPDEDRRRLPLQPIYFLAPE